MPIVIDEAIKTVDAYLSQVETLLTKSYKEGINKADELETVFENFVRITFSDGKEKLDYYRDDVPIKVLIGSREESEEEKQEYYILRLNIMKNHLVAYKEELQLRLASKMKMSELDRITEETRKIEAETKRRTAVAESKEWGARIEIIDMLRKELKRKDELSKQIIELRRDVDYLKSWVSYRQKQLEELSKKLKSLG